MILIAGNGVISPSLNPKQDSLEKNLPYKKKGRQYEKLDWHISLEK